MICARIGYISRAEAREFPEADFSVVKLFGQHSGENNYVDLFLPLGTAEAVAACINVAVAAGAQAAAPRTMGLNPDSIVEEAKS